MRWETLRTEVLLAAGWADRIVSLMLGLLILREGYLLIRMFRKERSAFLASLPEVIIYTLIFCLTFGGARIFKLPLLVYFGSEKPFRERMKTVLSAQILLCLIWVLFRQAGWLGDNIKHFGYGTFHSYGLNHPNNGGMFLFFLFVEWYCLFGTEKTAVTVIMSLLTAGCTYAVFGCRTAALLAVTILIIHLLCVVPHKFSLSLHRLCERHHRVFVLLFTLLPVFLLGLSFLLGMYLDQYPGILGKHIGQRFTELIDVYRLYGLDLFVRSEMLFTNIYLDNTYVWMLYGPGILASLGILLLMCSGCYAAAVSRRKELILSVLIILVYAVMERMPEHALFIALMAGYPASADPAGRNNRGLLKQNILRFLLFVTYALLLYILHTYSPVSKVISYRRYAFMYVLMLAIFGGFDCTTNLIWDESRKSILSHLCFFLAVNVMNSMRMWSLQLCLAHFVISAVMMPATILINRAYRILFRKYFCRRIIILGNGRNTEKLEMLYRTNRFAMAEVCAVFAMQEGEETGSEGCVHLPYTELDTYLREHTVDEAVIAFPQDRADFRAVYDRLVREIPTVRVMPVYRDPEPMNAASRIMDYDGTLVITVSDVSQDMPGLLIKRAADIIAGLLGLLILPFVSIFVKIGYLSSGDHGPIFFRQLRIGRDGQMFTLYKFRSMVENAAQMMPEILKDKEYMQEYEQNRKLTDDPRITPFGQRLRHSSIDELPQLINVLKGEMSLVGPRPYLPEEKEAIGSYYDAIIMMRPGMTGLWQIHGRSSTTFAQRIIYDNDYVHNWSVWLDLSILIRTVKVVLRRENSK